MLACLLTLPLLAPDVLTVDASGGGDHLDLPAAVAAAAPGDVLLVKGGEYTGFRVDGFGLSVVADPQAASRPVIYGVVELWNLPQDEELVLDGFELRYGPANDLNAWGGVDLRDNLGSVRLQACEVHGVSGEEADDLYGYAAVSVHASQDVAIASCELYGGAGLTSLGYTGGAPSPAGGEGLTVSQSKVSVNRSLLYGGYGGDQPFGGIGGDGGRGAWVFSGRAHFGHSLVQGGDSGDSGDGIFPGLCIDGANGLQVSAQAKASHQSAVFLGGAPGSYITQPCSFGGAPGAPVEGQVRPLAGQPKALLTPGVARAGELVLTSYLGAPGDLVGRAVSLDPTWRYRPGNGGILLVQPNQPMAVVGFTDGTGHLDVTESWSLPPGLEAGTLFLQGFFVDQDRRTVLSSPATVTVLDPAF